MSKFLVKCVSNYFQFGSNSHYPLATTIKHKSTANGKGDGRKRHGSSKTITPSNKDLLPILEKCQSDLKLRQSESKFGLPNLKPKECERRVVFAKSILPLLDQNPDLLNSILFSDEGNFWPEKPEVVVGGTAQNGGSRNKKRYFKNKIYAESQPLPTICWCGMTSKEVIGPYFFNSHVTGWMCLFSFGIRSVVAVNKRRPKRCFIENCTVKSVTQKLHCTHINT